MVKIENFHPHNTVRKKVFEVLFFGTIDAPHSLTQTHQKHTGKLARSMLV